MARSAVESSTALVTPVILGVVASGCAYIGAYEAHVPAVLMVAPVLALALSETRSARIWVSVVAHLALWAPLPAMAVAYGLPPVDAWLGISLIMLSQSLIVGMLPPLFGVGLWALSPFGFGHPLFGIFSIMPFWAFGSVGGLVTAVLILFGLAIRRTCVASLLGLAVLWIVSTVGTGLTEPTVLVPVATAFGERSLFPAEDWAAIGSKVRETEGLGPRLLPEATIGQDMDRGRRFFRELARTHGYDLLVGVSGNDGEEIVGFFKEGHIEIVHQQVQGVPFLNDGLALPWHYFLAKPTLIDDERVAFAICFEAFLPLTWTRILVQRSTTVAIVSNDRWTLSPIKIARAKLLAFPWPASAVTAANSAED